MNFNFKRILIFLAVAFVVVAASAMCVSAVSSSMNTEDFTLFKMDVPKDVDFVGAGVDDEDGLLTILYVNNNTDTMEDVLWLDMWFADSFTKIPSVESQFKLVKKVNDTKIYEYSGEDGKFYWVIKDFKQDSYSFGILGKDLKTLKKMANSIELTNTI